MRAQRPGEVLIVDADEFFLARVSETLYSMGHRVETCTTAHAARNFLQHTVFDVVVCAHRLPDQRGEMLCHFVKGDENFGTPFVALLLDMGLDGPEAEAILSREFSVDERQHSSTDPDDLIFKPISPAMLAFRISCLLRTSRYLEESRNAIGVLMSVAEGFETQDPRTSGHCKRLAIMSLELGSIVGCDELELSALERASYLHDIGMSTIHGGLAHKTGTLTPSEMEIIKTHPVRGEALCKPIAALKPVLPIIRHHHERADGSGYPDRLRGEKIPHLAQVFAIPHLYESLRLWRPYRNPLPHERAVAIIEDEVQRGCWNHKMFEAFIQGVVPGLEKRLDAQYIAWPK